MRVMLCTLCLNESEWLWHSYQQHKDWPGLVRWVFVETADRMYARANPDYVSDRGLSVDGTTQILSEIAALDPRVTYIPFGWTGSEDPAEGKIAARNVYLEIADEVKPDVLIVVDGDEFYAKADQQRVLNQMARPGFDSFVFRRREIWRPPSIADQPLFQYEVRGEFWDMACCHWWVYRPGMRHIHSHNTPEVEGRYMHRNACRLNHKHSAPQMIHLGFASRKEYRLAKNRYYVERGEGSQDGRQRYVDSRDIYRTWTPNQGFVLPDRSRVIPYDGPVPECFQ